MATIPPATLEVDTKVTGAAVRIVALQAAVQHHDNPTLYPASDSTVLETAAAFAKFLEGGA